MALVSLMMAVFAGAWAEPASLLLEKGIYAEETAGDLDAAMAVYQQIIDDAEANRTYVAQAYYRLGMCHLKRGEKDKGLALLQQVVAAYPEEMELVREANKILVQDIGKRISRNDPRSWVYFESKETGRGPELRLFFEDGAEHFPASGDTLLISYLADRPWGRHPQLSVNMSDMNRVLVAFCLPERLLSDALERAELVLSMKQSAIPTVETFDLAVYPVAEAWAELSTTWMNQPRVSDKPVTLATIPVTEGTVRIDVTATVAQWLKDSTANYGLMLKVGSPFYGLAPINTATGGRKYTEEEVRQASIDELFREMAYGKIGYNYFAGLWALIVKADMDAVAREAIIKRAAELAADTAAWGYERWLCCFVLSGIGDEESIPMLTKLLLEDPFADVREGAAGALGEYNADSAKRSLEQAAGIESNQRVLAVIQKALAGEFSKGKAPRVYTEQEASQSPEVVSESHSAKGWALWRKQEFEEAEKEFEKAVEIDSENVNAWNGLGWARFNSGKPLAARTAFEKCVALEPTHPAALNGLGWVAKGQGSVDEAIAYWEKAVEAAPTATAALNGLAVTYTELGDHNKAARYYKMWLEVEPDNTDAKAGLERAIALGGKAQTEQDKKAQWVERVKALQGHKQAGFGCIPKLMNDLPPDAAYEVVHDAWGPISDDEVKRGIAKAFTFRNHPRVLDVLYLAMTDESLKVRSTANAYVSMYTFRDFAEDRGAYESWHNRYRGQPLEKVVSEGLREAVSVLLEAEGAEQRHLAELIANGLRFGSLPPVRQAPIESGLVEVATAWLKDPDVHEDLHRASGVVLRALKLDEEYLRSEILPLLERSNPRRTRSVAAGLLGAEKNTWAVGPLLEVLIECLEDTGAFRTIIWGVAKALSEIGDPRAIPTMIAAIEADNTYDTVYGVGYFGLGRLTGVRYDESHDGAWWREWWEKNKGQFPEDVQALRIPDLKGKRKDVGLREAHAGGDEDKRYLLIGGDNSAPPEGGFRLLVVLPGGDGGPNSRHFVRRIHRIVLTKDYLVAQLVAKAWSEGQSEQLVWPTRTRPWPEMEFSTEEFVEAVIEDIKAKHEVNDKHITVFGWSSGGPPAYAVSLQENTAVAGAFVAMSVFKPAQLPSPEHAAGRAFYILHSPDDQLIPMRMPEAARDTLSANGAAVLLFTYEGGHGWHGDVYEMIREGMQWLEEKQRHTDKTDEVSSGNS